MEDSDIICSEALTNPESEGVQMREDEIKMLYGVIEELELEFCNFNAMREEKGKDKISLSEYLLLRQHALDLLRMENENCGELFAFPTFSVDVKNK